MICINWHDMSDEKIKPYFIKLKAHVIAHTQV